MSDTVITDVPAEGPPPIYDSAHLRRRIDELDAERKADFGVIWQSNGWGRLEGLLTAEAYRRIEDALAKYEPTAPADNGPELQALAERLYALPEPVRSSATEALKVYAGIDDPSRWLLTSTGRLAECHRIMDEADAYAQQIAADTVAPSVADLPVADDTADAVSSSQWPGPKADAKTVLAWVGDDLNRAARAYAHEQDRSSPRKGVTAKLEALLGDNLAKVQEALAAATPPPLDLETSAGVAPAPPAGAGAEAPGGAPPEDSGVGTAPSQAAASAPTIAEVEDAVADALRRIGEGFLALAEAVA